MQPGVPPPLFTQQVESSLLPFMHCVSTHAGALASCAEAELTRRSARRARIMARLGGSWAGGGDEMRDGTEARSMVMAMVVSMA